MAVELMRTGTEVDVPEPGEIRIVDVPDRRMLLIDGRGDPRSDMFGDALETLVSIAYALRWSVLGPRGIHAPVGAVEALYHSPGGAARRGGPSWTLMLEAPATARADDVEDAIALVRRRGRAVGTDWVRHEPFREGLAAEVLGTRPLATEAPAIERLDEAILSRGFRPYGPLHEIYLGDPTDDGPADFRTIVRRRVV